MKHLGFFIHKNLQLVFNTYDVTVEAMNKKVEGYLEIVQELQAKEEAGQTLISSEKRKLKISTQNSKALGQVEGILDQKIEEISTCEYLIPLYKEEFVGHKTDVQWLTRAINRMFKKDCTEDPLYAELVAEYQEVNPSPEASVLYAGLLMNKGETAKAIEFFERTAWGSEGAIYQNRNTQNHINLLHNPMYKRQL